MENEEGVAFNQAKNTNGNVEQDQRPSYSIPGILHFIQHEWTRFEMERAHWEVERAELQARIAFLQGERRGQENLKRDLVRRIKMLEYALRQERQKFHKLRYGTDLKLPDINDETTEEEPEVSSSNENLSKATNFNYRQGRQILRQYLQEIGYIDKVVELRSARVKMLLGLTSEEANGPTAPETVEQKSHLQNHTAPRVIASKPNEQLTQPGSVDGEKDKDIEDELVKKSPQFAVKQQVIKSVPNESDDAVMDSFSFLQREGQDAAEEEADDGGNADDELDDREFEDNRLSIKRTKQENQNDVIEKLPPDGAEIMKEFDFLAQEEQKNEANERSGQGGTQDEWHVDQGKLQKQIEQYKNERKAMGKKGKRPNKMALQSMLAKLEGEEDVSSAQAPSTPAIPANQNISLPNSSPFRDDIAPLGDVALPSSNYAARPVTPGQLKDAPNDAMEVALRLGDLADLTVSNEAGPLSVDINSREDIRKTWSPKYTLRSHFDGVRSLVFHPYESALITGSEDHTLKLWSLQRNSQMKKGNISDIEPVYTFRGHSGPILCLALNTSGSVCYSGGVDATIQWWNLPPLMLDLFGSYDPSVAGETLVAHTDAVWDLAVQAETDRLLSCSADGTCRLWNAELKSPLLCTYRAENETGNPTSVAFSTTDSGQMIASYTSSECVCFDLETAKISLRLDSAKTYNGTPFTQINKVLPHPTLPIVLTAHEDRHIRFFDINTGKQIHTMVAHLDAVTSLSIDPTGLYLLSGSHDGSIRLWNIENKTCIQEITAHRKKFDEAVFDVAFHPSQPFIASGGADAVAKVFV
ncbi:striatin-like [Rhopilema esculentum]|uniref:striatin-like n=1 Tax=Rhopilema esculentum TaxID=499914 RepID=UPI0031E05BEF|eukprot:gene2673-881_t